MKDTVGIFFAICFVIVAIALALFATNLKWRGFYILSICALAVLVLTRERISELVISIKEFKVKLSQVENQLDDISEAMETLVVAQQINGLVEGNVILLDYEPIPQSIKIIVGPITHFPRVNYGYKLQGKKIYILAEQTKNQIINRLPGGVTVEYLRKVSLRN